MTNNDYEVVVCKILHYFYKTMKDGNKPNENELSASYLKINNPYLMNVYKNLFEEKLLTGTKIIDDYSGNGYIEDFENIRITTAGVEFLKENKTMQKVIKYLKEIKDIFPFI